MSKLFLLTLLLTNAYPLRIPMIFDQYGEPYVDGRVEGLYGPELLRFRLSTYLTSSNRRPISEISLRAVRQFVSLVSPITFTEITRYSEPLFYVGSRSAWNGLPVISTLGIGSRSGLATAYGSVDFVNVIEPIHSGFLELGNPYESFAHDFCQPETVFNVTIDDDDYARGYVAGMGGGAIRSIAFMRTALPSGVGETGSRIDLPGAIYDEIISIVRRESDSIIREPLDGVSNFVFESCERVRNAIGPISIFFVEPQNTIGVQGRLLFEPSDFTQLVENDTCELLISNGFGDDSISIDVLMMKDVNIRFTRNQITFCDTSL
jgi:hypothetical protein